MKERLHSSSLTSLDGFIKRKREVFQCCRIPRMKDKHLPWKIVEFNNKQTKNEFLDASVIKMRPDTLEDQCSQCEELGEISYSELQRLHSDIPVKISVKNLPEDISELGLKNLFLTIGKPVSISFDSRSNSAFVVFKTLREAELAVRDLHLRPPYNLKVTVVTQKSLSESEETGDEIKSLESTWDFSIQDEPAKYEKKDDNVAKTDKVVDEIKSIIKNLRYDPSLRMRQKKLDFKTASDCVSMGRGYLYMGMNDHFVGGLQKFETSSKNSKAKNMMNFFCENCKALTSKICWDCLVPFCSKICLAKDSNYHKEDCLATRNNEVNSMLESDCLDLSFGNLNDNPVSSEYFKVSLKSGCTVIISTYLSMNTVFVRPSDESWEEKFTKLCNAVGVEAMKGEKFEKKPQVGDLVIGKYYQDLCFYRAQIISETEEKIVLFFIDFGNSQETNIEDLMPLPSHLKALPSFAVKVQLKNVPEGSSPESVNYFNNLTAKRVPLILNLDESGEVFLSEKDSGEAVNKTVYKFLQPSWKRDDLIYSKFDEVFFLDSIKQQKLEIGKTFNLIIAHFDEKEFLESEVFWVTNPETDDFLHVNSEMYLKIKEYGEFLKNEYYLPRDNELCLAKENGEWHRCVNLKSHKSTCCLFFLDNGRSSLIDTSNIRKMIQDFTEVPSQVVCCTLPDDPKLKSNEAIKSKVVQYLKESTGQTISSVWVMKLMGDAYCLSIPEIEKILAGGEPDT